MASRLMSLVIYVLYCPGKTSFKLLLLIQNFGGFLLQKKINASIPEAIPSTKCHALGKKSNNVSISRKTILFESICFDKYATPVRYVRDCINVIRIIKTDRKRDVAPTAIASDLWQNIRILEK